MADPCVFCERIAAGDFDAMDDHGVIRFEPLNPVAEGHMLFVPTEHVQDAGEVPEITAAVFGAAARWGQHSTQAFNLITSAGGEASQTVLHLHAHFVPRWADDGLKLPWSPS